MKKSLLSLALLICVAITLSAVICRGQAYTVTTTYSVIIHSDGSASWVILQSAYLQTQDDRTSFEQNISQAIDYSPSIMSEISTVVNEAYIRTGRFMAIDNFAVGGNVTESGVGAYGYLVYSFDWTNFAVLNGKDVRIGDAFSNDSFLFGEGELKVSAPNGYEVRSCLPSPDQNSGGTLTWNSVEGFQNGQPAILLSETNVLQTYLILVVLIIVAAGLLAVVAFFRVRIGKARNEASASVSKAGSTSDTEKILVFVKNEGGSVLQSRITEELRFSKAKTSKILGEMEKDGLITRHKTGRDKVVEFREK